MLLGADDVAERAVAFGVSEPLAFRMPEVSPCEGARVLSRWLDDVEESLAESGLVGCLRATREEILATSLTSLVGII